MSFENPPHFRDEKLFLTPDIYESVMDDGRKSKKKEEEKNKIKIEIE
jgi:hypothetical protein